MFILDTLVCVKLYSTVISFSLQIKLGIFYLLFLRFLTHENVSLSFWPFCCCYFFFIVLFCILWPFPHWLVGVLYSRYSSFLSYLLACAFSPLSSLSFHCIFGIMDFKCSKVKFIIFHSWLNISVSFFLHLNATKTFFYMKTFRYRSSINPELVFM